MAKSRSKHQKDKYAAYKAANTQAVNRKRKLLKLSKMFPANEQIKVALQNIKYRRCTPKTSVWSSTDKKLATMKKAFKPVPGTKLIKLSLKKMFSIAERVQYK